VPHGPDGVAMAKVSVRPSVNILPSVDVDRKVARFPDEPEDVDADSKHQGRKEGR
jgi:hypothetical protein